MAMKLRFNVWSSLAVAMCALLIAGHLDSRGALAQTNNSPVAADDSATTDQGVPVTIAVLGNDSDPDGDPLAVDSLTPPANGSAVINADHTVTYTPNPGFAGADSFSYSITDGSGGTASAAVSVTVNATNSAPVAVDDSATTAQGVPVTIAVLGNDSDPDGDPLAVDSLTPPANGSAILNADHTVTYTPNPGFAGADSFSYSITDGSGATASATVSVTVNATNNSPLAVDDSTTTDEGVPVMIAVLGNDSDPDGDPLAVDSLTPLANGSAVINADQTVTYTPNPGFAGADSFSYFIADGSGGTASAAVNVTVNATNNAPLAVDDSATTDQGVPVTIAVLGNDSDPDGNPLIVDSLTPPANGSAVINADHTVTYTPDPGFAGADSFSYSITDGATSAVGSVFVEVTSLVDEFTIAYGDTVPNGLPGAGNIEVPGARDVYHFQGNAGDGAIFDALSGDNGQVRWALHAPDGSQVFDAFYGDRQALLSQTGTYTLTVRGLNVSTSTGTYSFQLLLAPAPQDFTIALGDTVSDGVPAPGAGNIEAPGAIDVYRFDANAGQELIFDALAGNTGQFWRTLQAPDGTQVFDGFYVDQQVLLPQTGTYTLTLRGFSATSYGVYSFRLQVAATTQNFTIALGDTVSDGVPAPGAGNIEAPGAVDVYRFDAAAGQEIIFDALVGDTGQFWRTLQAPDGTQVFDGFYVDQQVLLPQTGTYTLTLRGFSVTSYGVYSFQLVVAATTQNFTIALGDTVSDGVPAPGAGNIEAPGAVDIYRFDAAAGQEILFDALTGDSGQFSRRLEAPDGTVVFDSFWVDQTANVTQTGTYTLTVTGLLVTDVGTYSFALLETVSNSDPVATDDEATTDEDTPVTIDVLANDSDADGDTLAVDSLTPPANGTAILNADHTISYTPAANFFGIVTFTYTVSDGNGGLASATVTVTVSPVSDASVAADDSATTDEDTPVTIDVLANDSDADGDTLTVDSLTPPANGTAILNADYTISYTPAANFFGIVTFTYTISDGNGGLATATVTVTVSAVNDAPVATDDSASTDEDTPVTIDVLANDSDADSDTLTVDSLTPPANGTAVLNADNTISYTPAADFFGIVTFTYTISDGNGGLASATVTVTVSPVNDAPVATDDSATTEEDTPVTIDVLANDSDADGDLLTVDSLTPPADGSTVINPDASVTYTPNAGFTGSDTFTYIVSDGNGGLASATVTVTVSPVNDAPVATDDSATTEEDTPVTIDVLANDSDADGDLLTVDSLTPPANGSAVINPDATTTYTPNAGFTSSDTFTYTVSDGNGGLASATVTVTVSPVNDAPVATDDSGTTDEDTPVTIDVLANDSDADGDALIVDSLTLPANGSAVINLDATVTYTPNAGFTGSDTFTYTVSDGNGGLATATVTVEVLGSEATTVRIDVLPFIWVNVINLNGRGIVPVAILSDADFDARSVDVDSVTLAGAPTVAPFPGWPKSNVLDVNFDWRRDMVMYFRIQDLALDPGATEVTLSGRTLSGVPFSGTDRVRIIPPVAPVLSALRDGATLNTSRPVLRWYPAALNTCYQVQIDSAPFAADEQSALQEATVETFTTYSASALPDGLYYWRVRVGGTCDVAAGPWSATRSFTVHTGA